MARILVAEDEEDIRNLIVLTLEFAQHQVIQAKDGVQAVELAKSELPDLIMTDVRMPKMTGYEACRIIKSDEGTKHIPVIILSAKGQDEEKEAGRQAGADDYILKPFEIAGLTQRITEILTDLGIS